MIEQHAFVDAAAEFNAGNYAIAIPALESLSECNHSEALGLLGVAYQLGAGVEADGVVAAGLLSRAARLGNGLAAHNLGTLYIAGAPGLQPSHELARAAYKRAKELGVALMPESACK